MKTAEIFKHLIKIWVFLLITLSGSAYAATLSSLANQPLFSTNVVPGNVALTLSVEWPTALLSSYKSGYSNTTEYLGYWDANKCYAYQSAPFTNSGFYNTGVNDANSLIAYNSSDMHWIVIGSGSTTMNVVSNIDTGNNASSRSLGNSNPARNTDFTYQTTFNIPVDTNLNNVIVQFKLAFGDSIQAIRVNNQSTGITYPTKDTSASVTTTLNASNSRFVIGSNTLAIVVRKGNSNNNAGLRVDDARVTYDGNYFVPMAQSAANHVCNTGTTKYWSGNFLNWALTQTIDPFRLALSGGYRSVDKVGLTVLEKALATNQGGTNTATITGQTLIAGATPFQNISNFKTRIQGLGNKFWFTATPNNINNTPNEDGVMPNTTTLVTGSVYQASARVKVCDASFLEANCTRYLNGDYKPTGQIQKNASRLNFAAFGYLLDGNSKRDGGVLRAKMGPVGPKNTAPGSLDVSNPNAEWNENTGIFIINPDNASATASVVSNSGVINYLNKFGLTANRYKDNDPVSELYYAATRYYKNQGNVPSYTSGLTDAFKDGFPVIDFTKATTPKTGDDPIKYECQTNFIIGIGDTNSWLDGNLPGSSFKSSTFEPTPPQEVVDDDTVNVTTATNKIGGFENIAGYTNLGQKEVPWCCDNNTFYIAGLAYDNHTKDIRPDDLPGQQTINTYWLDVLEAGDRFNTDGNNNTISGMRNQFWLTAKYGGFTVPPGYDAYATTTTAPLASAWDTNNDGDPDNYYRANNPKLMIEGLNTAFSKILSEASGTSIELPTNDRVLNSGDMVYSTSFSNTNWSGNLSGFTVTTSGNTFTKTKAWDARDIIQTQNWNTGRFIATAKCTNANNCGVPFRLASLATTDADKLGINATIKQNVLDFIRGNRSNETPTGSLRSRAYVLGDIVDSRIAVVGKPTEPYTDAFNPGYSAFKNATAQVNRQTMVYVGANDGMMHAIQGNSTGGNELFAYVPNALFNGPNNTPATDGLAALAKAAPDFEHRYYVNATPVTKDVNLGTDASPVWRTLLVGGLGKGGKAFYALDVTTPSTLNNETNLAAAVKWEFIDPDLGYSYGKPIITKANINGGGITFNGWVVIVASGYNNANGNGYFFIINAKTGALIKKIPTYGTAPSADAGLAHLSAYIPNGAKYVADAVYGADLLGGLWRLNLSNLAVTKLAELKDAAGNPQAVTIFPIVDVDIATGKRYVLFGTGKMLDETDSPSTANNTIYSINDGTAVENGFYINSTLPTGVTFPIIRNNLTSNTNTFSTTGVTSAVSNSMGWYIDLADKFYVDTEMETNAGLVAIATNKRTDAICSGSNATDGQGRTYAVSFGRGQSALNIPAGYIVTDYLIANVGFVKIGSSTGEPMLLPTGTRGQTVDPIALKNINGLKFKLLNWRDLPTASD